MNHQSNGIGAIKANPSTNRLNPTALVFHPLSDRQERSKVGDNWNVDECLNQKVKQVEDKFDAIVSSLDKQIKTLNSRCAKYEEDFKSLNLFVASQQRNLHHIDSDHRSRNIIVTGLSEYDILDDEGCISTTDEEKLDALFDVLGLDLPEGYDVQRLGKEGSTNCRAIKLYVKSRVIRDNILQKAETLKHLGKPWCNVYLRRDLEEYENKNASKLPVIPRIPMISSNISGITKDSQRYRRISNNSQKSPKTNMNFQRFSRAPNGSKRLPDISKELKRFPNIPRDF